MSAKKAAAVHKLQGTFQPSRHDREYETGAPPKMPPGFTEDVKACWNWLKRAAAANETPLLRQDAPALESAARLLARIRRDPDGVTAGEWSNYRSFLRELRLTASTRPPAPEQRDTEWDF